jgi:formylglycine-generating enzyme required for sulfatase activity
MSGLTEPLRHVIPLAKGVEMAFRLIPPGTFRMGSRGMRDDEEPVHWVEIREGFWMAETPVTRA